MKNFRKSICFVMINLFVQILFAGEITIYRDNYLNNNAACPKTEYQYWVDTKENYGRYEWKITGGYFKNGDKELQKFTNLTGQM